VYSTYKVIDVSEDRTEWNLVTGTLPPLSSEAWETEFEKYRQTPEFKLSVGIPFPNSLKKLVFTNCPTAACRMNSNIELSDFKTIFLWEYSHRLLGRIIGLSFLRENPLTDLATQDIAA
jgi:cytochrome c oxidase assembly protein subunit 15